LPIINAQSLPAHSPSANENALIGCTSGDLTDDWLLPVPVPISLTACANFAARLVAFFYPTTFIWQQCRLPFDNTTPMYLINLQWKLGLELRLDLKLHHFSIFHGE